MGDVFTIREFIEYYENFEYSSEYGELLKCETDLWIESVDPFYESKSTKKGLFSRAFSSLKRATFNFGKAIRRIFQKISKVRGVEITIPSELTTDVWTNEKIAQYFREHKMDLKTVFAKFKDIEDVKSKKKLKIKFDSSVDDQTRRDFTKIMQLAIDPNAKIIHKSIDKKKLFLAGVPIAAGLGILAKLNLCEKAIQSINIATPSTTSTQKQTEPKNSSSQPKNSENGTSKADAFKKRIVHNSDKAHTVEYLNQLRRIHSIGVEKYSSNGLLSSNKGGEAMMSGYANLRSSLESMIRDSESNQGTSYNKETLDRIQQIINRLQTMDRGWNAHRKNAVDIASKEINDPDNPDRSNLESQHRREIEKSKEIAFETTPSSICLEVAKILSGITTTSIEDAELIQISTRMLRNDGSITKEGPEYESKVFYVGSY